MKKKNPNKAKKEETRKKQEELRQKELEERTKREEEEDRVIINENVQGIADKVLVTAIKVISEIKRASALAAYANHPKLGSIVTIILV